MVRAFTTPTDAGYKCFPLRVAQHNGTSYVYDYADWEIGGRLRVLSVSMGEGRDYPRATLAVDTAGRYDTDGTVLVQPLRTSDLQEFMDYETRICIYSERPSVLQGGGSTSRVFIFEGYPKIDNLKFSGSPNSEFATFEIICTSLLERMAKHVCGSVHGRLCKSPTGAGAGWAEDYQFVSAMPCIFNFHNKPNRAANLIDIEYDGNNFKMPVFTYDGDPNAIYWTYADVLTYLIGYYVQSFGTSYPIQDGNGVTLCETVVAANAGPQDLGNVNNPTFQDIIKLKCPELVCQGQNIVESLQMWCESSRCMMQQFTKNSAGGPVTVLLFSLLGDGGPYLTDGATAERTYATTESDTLLSARLLPLENEGATIEGRNAADVLAKNVVEQSEIIFDGNNIISACSVFGDIEKFEVTLGKNCQTKATDIFKPGWVPDAMFGDGLSGGDVATKVEEILTANDPLTATGNSLTMFNRYDRSGTSHGSYASTGRLWVLNESGEWDGTTYGRTNNGITVWNAAAYDLPYDFQDNCGIDKARNPLTGQKEYKWLPRRRAILNLLSKSPNDASQSPIVYCSWDSGQHWYRYPGSYMFVGRNDPVKAQIALYLTDGNLGEVKNEKPTDGDVTLGWSIWESIVVGSFAIAITCAVHGDDRVCGNSDAGLTFDTSLPNMYVHTQNKFRYDTIDNGNSDLHGLTGWVNDELNEYSKARTYANQSIYMNQARRISGNIIIPYHAATWLPGDLCMGLGPRGPLFSVLHGDIARYPRVTRVLWVNGKNEQATHVTLDDLRTAARSA